MFQRDAFRSYFFNVLGGQQSSFNTYASYLKRIDEVITGGLDEFIRSNGPEGVRHWSRDASVGPFETYATQSRSILNSYLGFIEAGGEIAALEPVSDEIPSSTDDETQAIFRIEKEMQSAVRGDLESLEPGLIAIDEGREVTVGTGRIDILARDASGKVVIIELKAGSCPSSALEQVLGYAQAWQDENNEDTRAILIASSFSDRQRAAAKRAIGLVLKTYRFSLAYRPA